MAVAALGLYSLSVGAGMTLSGGTVSVSVANSVAIAGAGNGSVQLVNDSASPGANMFYGTDGAGVRGWLSDSSVYVTSLTGTAGQVLVGGTSGSPQTGALTLTLATALTSINSITATSATDLVLNGGSSGASLALGQGVNGGVTLTPKGAGGMSASLSAALVTTLTNAVASTAAPQLVMRKARGSIGAEADVTSGDNTFVIVGQAYSGGTYFGGADIEGVVDGTFTSGQRPPSRIDFYTNLANAAQQNNMRLTGAGNLLIGGTTDITGSGGLKVFGGTASTSTTTGAFQVVGGVGIGGALNVGGNLTVSGTGTSSFAGGASFFGGDITRTSATSGAGNYISVINTSNTANSGSFLNLQTGGTSGGTSAVQYYNGTTAVYAGFTTSFANYFISSSANGSSPWFTLTSSVAAFTGATDATSISSASLTAAGGAAITKNLLSGQGQGWGVTSTATAAGTTTLTSASRAVQIFTGTTTQTVVLPAANVFGAGVGAVYVFKNTSSGIVTINPAGSDTIDGATSYPLAANNSVILISNGSNAWVIC